MYFVGRPTAKRRQRANMYSTAPHGLFYKICTASCGDSSGGLWRLPLPGCAVSLLNSASFSSKQFCDPRMACINWPNYADHIGASGSAVGAAAVSLSLSDISLSLNYFSVTMLFVHKDLECHFCITLHYNNYTDPCTTPITSPTTICMLHYTISGSIFSV